MSYRQTKFQSNVHNELLSVLSCSEYIDNTTPLKYSPFGKNSIVLTFKKRMLICSVKVMQLIVGKTLYYEDDRALLYQLPPETRALFSWLIANNLLATWSLGRPQLGISLVKTLYLFPEPIKTPTGKSFAAMGANGIGSGDTYAEAALSALGEFIERNASSAYWWENSKIYKSKFKKHSRQVNPEHFNLINVDHISKDTDAIVSHTEKELSWVSAIDIKTQNTVDVPASLVYMYFRNEYAEEPFLQEVSSNGAATYSTYHEACTRAMLELIERHVFMKMWYHKTPCNKINVKSLEIIFPQLKELTLSLTDDEQLDIYEIPNSLNVPTFFATLTSNDISKTALHLTAASDVDVHSALKKVIKEVVRFAEGTLVFNKESVAPFDITSAVELQAFANTLTKRGELWSYQEMLPHLSWLKESTEIQYSEITSSQQPINFSERERYQWVKAQCVANEVRVYISDVTNSVARYAKLHVVRAISPDLIPIFFNEQYKPFNQGVFTCSDKGEKVVLNQIPHPFL